MIGRGQMQVRQECIASEFIAFRNYWLGLMVRPPTRYAVSPEFD
jgi:hypothetical protein